ncbi:probable calcium-binding protein CML45 [Papaver somniferum]|uniref:probable calcium-binding protein CML45 n=1 Tax=Papaver somniferum TaxID=3469 RepID=UPI000E6F5E8F|nr:probable calcium-binding protein CML45 [Papaver somniferum]
MERTLSPSLSLIPFLGFSYTIEFSIVFKFTTQNTAETSSNSANKLCNDNEIASKDASVNGERMVASDDNVGKLYVGDVEMRLNSVEFSNLFDEDEPSLTELKKAFDLFDQNKDGFIDERELQDVLFKLGFKEGHDIKECKRMIRVFDDNRDGRIDFNEFVKCMEKSFE